ncbi:MAG: hypothetical protein GY953_01815, partial [bacterium]|nr:hypothetical protein [bacterium]
LSEAAELIEAGLAADIALKDWQNASISAGNLSELYLALGDVPRAVDSARRRVDYADRSGDAFQRMAKPANLANALHQAGPPPRNLVGHVSGNI